MICPLWKASATGREVQNGIRQVAVAAAALPGFQEVIRRHIQFSRDRFQIEAVFHELPQGGNLYSAESKLAAGAKRRQSDVSLTLKGFPLGCSG